MFKGSALFILGFWGFFLIFRTKAMFSFGLRGFCNTWTVVKRGKEESCLVHTFAVRQVKQSGVLQTGAHCYSVPISPSRSQPEGCVHALCLGESTWGCRLVQAARLALPR